MNRPEGSRAAVLETGEKVLLFAHPRSGSSNLCEILQLHPHLQICEEPFNENYVRWARGNEDYLARVHDASSLDQVLDEIFASYNGLKFLNYQLPDELVVHLLRRQDLRIIFLKRRNALQAIVSVLVAEQTGLWHKWDAAGPVESYYRNIGPLDADEVRERVRGLSRHIANCESALATRGDGRSLTLVYEDLFFAPERAQATLMAGIWAFLGLPAMNSERISYFLRPESTKLYPLGRYDFLPNAQEINDRCGGDETGWLFEEDEVLPAVQLAAAPDDGRVT